jgi:transcriptional regulator with XRE-family HTH domain
MKNIYFPDIIRNIRTIKGITLKEASFSLGICHRTLSRAERGEAPLLAGYLPPLADCFDMSPADFFYFNPATKTFERPLPNDYASLKEETEALKMQVRQLSEYIQVLQNSKGG